MPVGVDNHLRPETQVLLLVSRTRLSSEQSARLRSLLQGQIDWPSLLARSGDHGVFPLLYNHLNSSAADLVPAAWLGFLRDLFRQNAQRSLQLTSELIRLVAHLDKSGITAVPYKGPVLAALAYGNLGLRYFQDLDILVSHRDILRAQQVFLSLGYRAITAATPADIEAGRFPGQYAFSKSPDNVLLEVHSERTLRYFPVPPDFERLWQRLERIELGGAQIPTLSSADLFSFLSIHGTKHLWARLSWICDIAELARRQNPLEWTPVHERAISYGAQRMVALTLLLARDLLDVSLPPQVAARLQDDAAVSSLAEGLRSQIIADDPSRWGAVGRFWFRVRMRPRLEEGIRYGLRLAMKPTEEDWVGESASALTGARSAGRRLLRLVGKYGLGPLSANPDASSAGFDLLAPEQAVKLLDFAEVHPGDVLYDLSPGGRVAIEAAKRFGVRAVGIDPDSQRVAGARRAARNASVGHLVAFHCKDILGVDLSDATVVILNFPWSTTLALRDTLRRRMRPGTRLLSCNSGMGDWPPEKTELVDSGSGAPVRLFLWRIS